jgi:hypothetical protein
MAYRILQLADIVRPSMESLRVNFADQHQDHFIGANTTITYYISLDWIYCVGK